MSEVHEIYLIPTLDLNYTNGKIGLTYLNVITLLAGNTNICVHAYINPLPTNDAHMHHEACLLSISP